MTMELYRQGASKFWTADFVVDGRRIRKSTKKSMKTAAMEVAMAFYRQAQQKQLPARRRPALLSEFAEKKFLPFIKAGSLDADTKRYYETGWRLLSKTPAKGWRLDQIKGSQAEVLSFPASGANANCGLRTLRRMLSLAHDWDIIDRKPRIRLRKEVERSAVFDPEAEKRFLEKAAQPLRDVFLISHDAGLRPDEVIRMRWEDVLWSKNLIFVPDGKTENAKRHVPLSDRVRELLTERQTATGSPWVFPSRRRKKRHISYFSVAKQFSAVRKEAQIPKGVVLYSARHSFATDMLDRTGNIVLVGKMLGHRSVTTTQRYLHPEMKGLAELVNERNAKRAQQESR
ncbi:MAG: site-specific integrase [Acidobacteriaceae bacterium]